MTKEQKLLLFTGAQLLVVSSVSMYVTKQQEKTIKKQARFQKSLIEVIGTYEPFVPREVRAQMHEKVQFDAIAREFDE